MPPALAALLTALAADPATPVVIAWSVPEGCPGVEALHAGIQRSLGDLPAAGREPVRVSVAVIPEAPQRFRLELRLEASDGPTERTLATDSCAAAIDTAAWLIAVAIDVRAVDPESQAIVPAPGGSSVDTPAPPRVGEDPVPTLPETRRATSEVAADPRLSPDASRTPQGSSADLRRSALHVDAWAGGGLGLGVLPGVTPTTTLGFTLAGARWEAEVSGHAWAVRRVELGDGIGGRFVHGSAAARGCGAWERGRVRVPLCAGLALGGVSGEGTGALMPRVARSLWIGLLAGAGVRVRLHPRVALLARAEAVIGLRRPGFLLEPAQGLVFRPSAVGFSALLALAVRLR